LKVIKIYNIAVVHASENYQLPHKTVKCRISFGFNFYACKWNGKKLYQLPEQLHILDLELDPYPILPTPHPAASINLK
jgi:hypothetical protein